MGDRAVIVRLNPSTCEVHSVNLTLAMQDEWYGGFALKLSVDVLLLGLGLLMVLCRLSLQCGSTGRGARTSGAWHRAFTAHILRADGSRRMPLLNRKTIVEPVESWWQSKMAKEPTVFKNYMRCLRITFFTFLCLFVIGYSLDPSTTAHTSWGLSMMFQRGKFYHQLMEGNSSGLLYLLVAVFLKGLVLLASTVLLEQRCEQSAVSDEVCSTIWVHGLPVKDQRMSLFLRETFALTSDELKRVGTDLATVVDEQMGKGRGPEQPLGAQGAEEGEWVVDEWDAQLHPRGTTCDPKEYSGHWFVGDFIGAKGIYYKPSDKRAAVFVRKVAAQEASRVARVWVTPNVKKWRTISHELDQAIRCQEAYDEWKLRYETSRGTSCWNVVWHSWYSWRSDACKLWIQQLEVRLLRTRLRNMHLNGCAFVQFRTPKDASRFLGKPPERWDCLRWWCWYKSFKFGHIPFSSVTLEYEPAPHPNDIIWDNMDTPRWIGWLSFHFLALMVYVAMLLIVISINLPTAFTWLMAKGDMYDRQSPLLLLLVNSTILPNLVQCITSAGRFWRRADEERRRFTLNFWLILWSLVLVLLLHGSRLQHWPGMFLDGSFLQCMLWDLHLDPGELSLGYLVDVTFLTNAYQVLAILRFKLLGQLRARLMTARALDNGKVGPPCFPFSFHYAWILSVLALSLWTSNEVPGILLIAACYVLLKACVDWCNLHYRVYEVRPQHDDRAFMNQVVFSLRIVASVWWLTTGTAIWQLCGQDRDHEERCPSWASAAGRLLAVLSLVVLVASLLQRAYADNIRRFIQGRLQEEPQREEEDLSASQGSGDLFYAATSMRSLSSSVDEERPDWDARPHFGSKDVEEIIASIRMRPSLEGPVFQGLREGKTVQEVLRQVRGCRRTCSCTL